MLQNDFNQTIQSGIIFVEEVFAANADASAPINGISLRNIVTTYSDQILSGPYNFSSAVNIAGDLQNNGSINGININEWYNKGLKKQWKKVQKVNGRYNIYGNLTFTEDVDGSGRVNGLDLRTALEDLERKKAAKYAIEKDVMVKKKDFHCCKFGCYCFIVFIERLHQSLRGRQPHSTRIQEANP